jgi:heat shock protein HslJ
MEYLLWTHVNRGGFPKISRCPIAQAGADEEVAPVSRRESQSVEVKEVPPVKRLDGEVVRQGETAFTGGMYCEVWVGQWEKGGGKLDPEKVSLSLNAPILLI